MDELEQEASELQHKISTFSLESNTDSTHDQLSIVQTKVLDEIIPAISSIRHANSCFQQELKDISSNITKYHTLKSNISACLEFLGNYQKLHSLTALLASLILAREYSRIGPLFSKLEPLLEYFSHFSTINCIQRQLNETTKMLEELKRTLMQECQVHPLSEVHYDIIEKLGASVKDEFIQNCIKQELGDYASLFKTNQNTFCLEGISKRIQWFLTSFSPDSRPIAFSNYPQNWNLSQALCFRFVFILKKDIEAIIQIPPTQSVLDTVKNCAEFEEKLALICPMLKWKGVLTYLFDELIQNEFCNKTEQELKALFKEFGFWHVRNSFLESSTNICLACKSCIYSCANLSNRQTFVSLVALLQKYLQKYIHIVVHDCNCDLTIRINTLSYCIEMIQQLQDISFRLVDEKLKEKVGFDELIGFIIEKNKYLIFCIVRKFVIKADKYFTLLKGIEWQRIQNTTDCTLAIQSLSVLIRNYLKEAQEGLTAKCDFYHFFDRLAE